MIHPSAVIEPQAVIGEGTTIGEGCFIGKHVVIGKHNTIASQVVIDGYTTIGEHNTIGTHTVLGTAPQDIKSTSTDVGLIIGDHNQIGAEILISAGTDHGGKITRIGDHNRLMDRIHIGHDGQMQHHCLMEEASALGGHVIIASHVTLGKTAAVHQFVEIGEGAIVSQDAALTQDLPPYCIATGNRAKVSGLNLELLPALSIPQTEIDALKEAYHTLFETHLSPKAHAISALETETLETLKTLYHFIANSKRGIPFRRNTDVN